MSRTSGDFRPWHLLAPHVEGVIGLERPPTDSEIRWGITAEELARRHRSTLSADGPRERMCWECGLRVTERDSKPDVGHAAGYRPRRPACSQHPGTDLDPDAKAQAKRPASEWPVWRLFNVPSLPNHMSRADPGHWTRCARSSAHSNRYPPDELVSDDAAES